MTEVERMKREISEWKEKHGEIEPAPDTVTEEVAETATARVKPLLAFIVKYVTICDKSDSVVELSDDHLTYINSFGDEIAAMNGHQTYRICGRLTAGLVATMNKRKEYEHPESYISRLAMMAKVANFDAFKRARERG